MNLAMAGPKPLRRYVCLMSSLTANAGPLSGASRIAGGSCATSVRTFNERAGASGLSVLCVSKDLPFAQKRFCGAEGIENVMTASAFRDSFGEDYGITIADGPMAGLLGRAVVVIGADGNVVYVELVPEIATEPNNDAALAAVS